MNKFSSKSDFDKLNKFRFITSKEVKCPQCGSYGKQGRVSVNFKNPYFWIGLLSYVWCNFEFKRDGGSWILIITLFISGMYLLFKAGSNMNKCSCISCGFQHYPEATTFYNFNYKK
jgi:hypothetical protein